MLVNGNEVPPSLHFPIQGKLEAAQTMQQSTPTTSTKENTTSLSDTLKAGIETLSDLSMDGVQVHYNSPSLGIWMEISTVFEYTALLFS